MHNYLFGIVATQVIAYYSLGVPTTDPLFPNWRSKVGMWINTIFIIVKMLLGVANLLAIIANVVIIVWACIADTWWKPVLAVLFGQIVAGLLHLIFAFTVAPFCKFLLIPAALWTFFEFYHTFYI